MEKLDLVFIPCPLTGHIASMKEFVNRMVTHHPQFRATVLLMNLPWQSPSTTSPDTYSVNNIRFVILPEVSPPPQKFLHECPEKYFSTYIASHKAHVRDAIANTNTINSSNIAGIVIDMFSTSMIEVANEFSLPTYLFYTSGIAFLGLTLHLDESSHFTESDPDLTIPTFVNPIPTRVLPDPFLDNARYQEVVVQIRRIRETKGVMVNTFAELEPHATESFLNGKIVGHIPPVYCVGPVLGLKKAQGQSISDGERDMIVKWLDAQPDSSVVLLGFGSEGVLGELQVREIAVGLEASGVRFLWSLRKPPSQDGLNVPGDYTEEELKGVLPSSFLTLLKGETRRGVVCGWVPQVEVLAHRAVGGFVSHCGWNSILESLWFGVPIVTWPLYAEQQLNAFELVKELGLAVELRLDYKMSKPGEVVKSDELERAIRCVMDPDNPVRKRVMEISEIGKKAVVEGGSSFQAMEQLVRDIVERKLNT